MGDKQYRAVKISAGARGWGGPLVIEPKEGKNLIYCVTGGGIHPVAQRIAELTGGEAFDGFRSKRDFEQIAVAVIDCGGTARVGVYPMKGVLTVDVYATKPSGPLFRFIKEDNFVSGVGLDQIQLVDGETPPVSSEPEKVESAATAAAAKDTKTAAEEASETSNDNGTKKKGFFGRLFGG